MQRGSCPKCGEAGKASISKKGYYYTKWNAQPVARYRCTKCGKCFSSHTSRVTYRQKKPYLNEAVFRWYASGTTQRRIAVVLGVNRKTVVRKFLFMARRARDYHDEQITSGKLVASNFQFDEMESFEHTRLKPLSIALAVTSERKIVDIQVAQMPYRGKVARIAFKKYGPRKDKRKKARVAVLKSIRSCATGPGVILSDQHKAYPKLIEDSLPSFTHRAVASPKKDLLHKTTRPNRDDELFVLNHTAAKIRHDLSRMARRVWVTTKKRSRLQAHLDLYIAYQNQYPLSA